MRRGELDDYRRKRDPSDDAGAVRRREARRGAPIFVVQRHDARRLHYDFRLERDGALASLGGAEGRAARARASSALAVHVEDHPLEYATLRGRDPEGPVRRRARSRSGTAARTSCVEEKRDGGLTVRLARRAARGHVDARAGAPRRRREELAAHPQARRAARRRPSGRAYKPMLATLAERAARAGDGWLFEVKWDGYRALALRARRRGAAALAQRQRPDRALRRASRRRWRKALKTPDASLDGEVCALDEHGPAELLGDAAGRAGTPLVYYVFDLLEVDGEPLVDLPLERAAGAARGAARRGAAGRSGSRRRSRTARRCSRRRSEQGLEGVMAKRADSRVPRRGSATRDWLKVKTHGRQEFVDRRLHAGPGAPRAARFGSLVLGVRRGRRARAGSATSAPASTERGDRAAARAAAAARARRRRRSASVPKMPQRPQGRRRLGRAASSSPRSSSPSGRTTAACAQPSYQGLRDDKPARARCAASEPLAGRDPRRAGACCGSRTSTRSSGPTRGSPRAT